MNDFSILTSYSVFIFIIFLRIIIKRQLLFNGGLEQTFILIFFSIKTIKRKLLFVFDAFLTKRKNLLQKGYL